MVRFIHTADWQLGKPFVGIREPEARGFVKEARFRTIERIGEVAERDGASFVVVAGDLFDSNTADKATVSRACQAIGKIGVPVLVISGNHDHSGLGTVWEQGFFRTERDAFAPNLQVLLEPEPVELDDAVILPSPLKLRSAPEDPTQWLRTFDYSSLPDHKPRIVLAHGSVHDFSSSDGEFATNLLDLEALPMDEIDYIALGDWHGTTEVKGVSKAWYSGTHEPDRYPHGPNYDSGNVLVVDVSRGEEPRVKKVPTAELRWLVKEFTFGGGDDPIADLEESLEQELGGKESNTLLQVTLKGSLGIEAAHRLKEAEERWRARVRYLVWENETTIAPTQEELESLTEDSGDPLIASVAKDLLERCVGDGKDAEVARLALQELYSACKEV